MIRWVQDCEGVIRALNSRLSKVDCIVGIHLETVHPAGDSEFGLTSALQGREITMGGRRKQYPVSYDLAQFSGECI